MLNSTWEWMGPGARALALVAPIGTLVVTCVVAIAAYFTFKLRARVDHVEQWWKLLNAAVDRGLSQDLDSNKIGGLILETLQSRQPPTKPEQWVGNGINPSYAVEMKDYRKALATYKKSQRLRWKISEREEDLLVNISETPAFRVLS